MSSLPCSKTTAGLRWIVGSSALLATVVFTDPRASAADAVLLSCTAKRHVAVLDVEKVDTALADGDLSSSMSETEAQAAITKLSAKALKCFLKPGDKARLANTSVVHDPIWLAVSDEDSSCMGVVLGKAAFECESSSDTDKPIASAPSGRGLLPYSWAGWVAVALSALYGALHALNRRE